MNSGKHPVDAAGDERAAYVHIPFCRRRCPYCDFAVVDMSISATDFDRYVNAVIAEIEMEAEWHPLHAVNFGGGTPSALDVSQIEALLDAIRCRFGLVAGAEVSIEANPEDWHAGYATALAGIGVNRVSLGVQSFDPDVLSYLGRRHSPEQGTAAVAAGREAGISSVNLDLIFGSPIESLVSWQETVATALDLHPDHISVYALTVELGTELSRSIAVGAPAPDDDDQADKYEHFADAAAEHGLGHYEVSNWARPGHECRYNLTTWAHGEYIAFGTGAHAYRDGVRSRNVRRLDRYVEAVEAGTRPTAGTEQLTGWEIERERLFVGLRRTAGAETGEFGRRFLASPAGTRLVDAGIVGTDGDRMVVVDPLLTDAVAREVLAFDPQD